jgi:hypothetical protein
MREREKRERESEERERKKEIVYVCVCAFVGRKCKGEGVAVSGAREAGLGEGGGM